MKNRIIGIFLVIILCGYLFCIPIFAKETPDELKNLYAQSAVLMDADSGRILFGKKENNVMPMASTTKIMTCILALELMEEGQIGEVSETAQKQPKVHLGVRKGEKYYLEDLLYSLMLESHNDSAVVIAESIAGSVENFAKLMNDKAKKIGCEYTYFITPNGLDAENKTGIHSTTAKDLALIMRYCIVQSPEKEEFIKITQTDSWEFSCICKERKFKCNNHNAFLKMMDGALAGKTGFTNNAGYCYVGALRRGKRTFIVALLACGWPNHKNYKWSDTRKLMEYGLETYEYRDVWKDMRTKMLLVENGYDHYDPLNREIYTKTIVINEGENIQILMKSDEILNYKIVMKTSIKAPVKKGQKVGKVFCVIDSDVIEEYDIVTEQPVRKRNYAVYLKYLQKKLML